MIERTLGRHRRGKTLPTWKLEIGLYAVAVGYLILSVLATRFAV